MQRLVDPMRGVPGGFQFVHEPTGHRIVASNYNAWIQKALKFYQDNGYPTENLVEMLEDKLCENLKDDYCQDPSLPGAHVQFSYAVGAIGRSIHGLLRGTQLQATDELAKQRLTICESCPHFRQSDKRCSICGCHLKQKAFLALERCPQDRW